MAKLFKRGDVYYAWVPRPGGGYRKVTTGCTDVKAAREVQKRLERDSADPVHAAQDKARTGDLLNDLLASIQRNERSPATLTFNRQKAGNLGRLLPARAAEITHAELLRYIDARRAETAAPATIKKELGVLRAALNLAVLNGAFATDPKKILPQYEAEYVPRTRVLTWWELATFLMVLSPMKAARVAWMVATGARWGESVRAQAEDIRAEGARGVIRGTKTKASRTEVSVPPPYRRMLHWALERANPEGKLFDAWVSPGNELRRLCERAGVPHVSFNDLRRTHATWLSDLGIEPHYIAQQLRHTTSAMAERVYAKPRADATGRMFEERLGRGLLVGGAKEVTVMSGERGESDSAGKEAFLVGQDRLELSANGLRDRLESRQDSEKDPHSESGWAAGGKQGTYSEESGGPGAGEKLPSHHGAELDTDAFAHRLAADDAEVGS